MGLISLRIPITERRDLLAMFEVGTWTWRMIQRRRVSPARLLEGAS
jgi:hypothetical protein